MIVGLFIIQCVLICQTFGENRTTLHIGILLELTRSWYRAYTHGFIDIFEKVFTDIQNRHELLLGYDFKLTIKDTKVSSAIIKGITVYHLLNV